MRAGRRSGRMRVTAGFPFWRAQPWALILDRLAGYLAGAAPSRSSP